MKQVQVIWTDEAVLDLEIIYDFIAEESPVAAEKIIKGILSRTHQLETFPESGPIQETRHMKVRQYRYLVEGNYKIIYSIEGQAVFVEVVMDTRQDPGKLRL